MIIYLVMEIAARELMGHLLLGVLAASRGHQVLIGPINDMWLYNRMKLLPPGPLIVKNMNVPPVSEKIYNSLINDGFDIYCHEAEPAILSSDFDTFIRAYRITGDQLLPFKGVFCWGQRDYDGYTKLFSHKRDIFHITGSPRVDLWLPNLKAFWQRDYIEDLKPYILFVSNNSWAVGKRHWTSFLAVQQNLGLTEVEENERDLYRTMLKDVVMVENAVFSLRDLAQKYPEINFIIRPHPWDNEDYWKVAVGEYKNIHVIFKEGLTPWVSGATGLIHNSCTSAIEASIQGVPVISYVPSPEISDMLDIANACGVRVENHQALESAIENILNEHQEHIMSENSRSLLSPLIAITDESASSKIVNEIEKSSRDLASNTISGYNFLAITAARQSKTAFDKIKRMDLSYQNYHFNKKDVRDTVRKISGILGVPCPKIRFASDSTMLIG